MARKTAGDVYKSPFQRRFCRDVSHGHGYVVPFAFPLMFPPSSLGVLTLASSVVQGVREWIRSSTPTERQKRHQNQPHVENNAAKAQAHAQQDRNTSEYLAMQLLAPFVSEDEQDEYQEYGLSTFFLLHVRDIHSPFFNSQVH